VELYGQLWKHNSYTPTEQQCKEEKPLIQQVYSVCLLISTYRFDPLCGSVYTLLLIRGCLCMMWIMYFQESHYLMSVATLALITYTIIIAIRVYLWCSGWSYWAGRDWALIGVKVLHVECFSSLAAWVECTSHTVAWLKWFRQTDWWMLTPWNHLYKRTFHWAWHFSMDPVHVASHFLNSHSTKGISGALRTGTSSSTRAAVFWLP